MEVRQDTVLLREYRSLGWIVRPLRALGRSLSAILWTGSKSLHIWFEMPPEDHVAALTESMATLGIDPSLIGKPEHPARLPGVIHKKTGKRSQTLWLQK